MGLDIELQKQDKRYDFEFEFMKESQPHHFTKEDVIKLNKYNITDHKDWFKDEMIHLKSYDGKLTSFNYRRFLTKFFSTGIKSFDNEKMKERLKYARKNGKREFMDRLITIAFGYGTPNSYIGICKKGDVPSFRLFKGDLGTDFQIDEVTEVIFERNDYEIGIDRLSNRSINQFMLEKFEAFDLTDKEQAFVFLMKDYIFYISNDPGVYPLFFLHQQKEMFEKYKPEFLDQKISDYSEETLTFRGILDSMIKHRLEFVAG